jgi:glyoxylase-like metal-dependent hydrolase (beta-lactamase superfamily II)
MYRHGDLRIEIFNDSFFAENGMLVWLDGQPECWIIDPGFPPQPEEILAALRRSGLTSPTIVLTHAHADHIAGITPLRGALPDVPIVAPRDEARLLTDANENLSAPLGMPVTAPPADRLIAPGQTLTLGPSQWIALDVSGHSPGGLAYHCSELRVAFVGDALFAEGIGRTDFPHSDHPRLIRNIRDHLLTLPHETRLYPGHGPPATIADILAYNLTLRMELRR